MANKIKETYGFYLTEIPVKSGRKQVVCFCRDTFIAICYQETLGM